MKTVINIKTDKDIKEKAAKVAKDIGIPLSTLINAYLRELAATGKVEFTATERMTPQMERIIERAEREIARGEVSPAFDNVEDFLADLKRK